jgi:Cu+-exporting ATPase
MATDMVHDPVCHMNIDKDSAPAKSQYKGAEYYFCSPGCKRTFDSNSDRVLQSELEFHRVKAN